MLALSPLRTSIGRSDGGETGEILLEDFNFDDLFVGFDDRDMLPDLEIDPSDIFVDFSFSSGEDSGNTAAAGGDVEKASGEENNNNKREDKDLTQGEAEVVSARSKDDGGGSPDKTEGCNKGHQPSSMSAAAAAASSKASQGKKKAKVDWTPELHRRFVQAVEQLGVDKAVPSRILELMGIDCLTRHNIASHLQKYRSHRKHLLAREAEAASWTHRRQIYTGGGGGGGANKLSMNPNWAGPLIIGFPPPMQRQQQHLRPLHVWGHPTFEHPPLVPMWPRPPWEPPRQPHAQPNPSFWHHYPHFQRPPLTQGAPCFAPQLLPATLTMQRSYPPHPIFRPPPPHAAAPPPSSSQIQLDAAAQPSKESIDEAIGDVLAKPWQPLPLGLKPPSLESVMVELQKQGVQKVPPSCN